MLNRRASSKGILTAVFVIIAIFIFVTPVRADIAPPAPPSGSNPEGTLSLFTSVQMVSEVVHIDVAMNGPGDDSNARITASFIMNNKGDEEEKILVRFPLSNEREGGCDEWMYPTIDDIMVWVNGKLVPTTTIYERGFRNIDSDQQINIPCWASFPVTFAVGKDIAIKVSYTVTGDYGNHFDNYVVYQYLLTTGYGWFGPIGRADIIVSFPYEVNEKNVGPDPSEADDEFTFDGMHGKELRWHAENFEPGRDFYIGFLDPSIWQAILTETKNTTLHPNDGEAWGRLAKALKEALWEYKVNSMQRNGPAAIEMFEQSKQAYLKAISLLPKDADWRYGYAELLCGEEKSYRIGEDANLPPNWLPCIEQMKSVLDLNPDYEKAIQYLQYFSYMEIPGIVDLSGPKPVYLILTATPTFIPL